jgi:hypothetical protein
VWAIFENFGDFHENFLVKNLSPEPSVGFFCAGYPRNLGESYVYIYHKIYQGPVRNGWKTVLLKILMEG